MFLHKPFPRNILQIPKNPVVLWFVLFVSEIYNSVGLCRLNCIGVIAAFPQQKFLVCNPLPMPPDSLFNAFGSHRKAAQNKKTAQGVLLYPLAAVRRFWVAKVALSASCGALIGSVSPQRAGRVIAGRGFASHPAVAFQALTFDRFTRACFASYAAAVKLAIKCRNYFFFWCHFFISVAVSIRRRLARLIRPAARPGAFRRPNARRRAVIM